MRPGLERPENAKRPPEHFALVADVLLWSSVRLDRRAWRVDDLCARHAVIVAGPGHTGGTLCLNGRACSALVDWRWPRRSAAQRFSEARGRLALPRRPRHRSAPLKIWPPRTGPGRSNGSSTMKNN